VSGKAAKVVITERQQAVLQKMSRSTTIAYRLRQRAEVILFAFAGKRNDEIEPLVDLGHDQVGKWRRRWQNAFERLTIIEGLEEPCDLAHAIEDVLSDEQRSGAPSTFTAEQLTMIFAIACEAVEDSGRPVARWTQREIIDEAVKRGIITSMSESHLSVLLSEAELQPHKSRYWLNTREKDPVVFEQQVQTVCECYHEATELAANSNTQTVCVDEMTSVQALERKAPKKNEARPGRANRVRIRPTRHALPDCQF
jgi:transposase